MRISVTLIKDNEKTGAIQPKQKNLTDYGISSLPISLSGHFQNFVCHNLKKNRVCGIQVNDFLRKHYFMQYLCLEGEQVPFKINTMDKNTTYGKEILGISVSVFLLLFFLINNELACKYQIINNINFKTHCYFIVIPLIFHCYFIDISLFSHCYFGGFLPGFFRKYACPYPT